MAVNCYEHKLYYGYTPFTCFKAKPYPLIPYKRIVSFHHCNFNNSLK